MSGRNIDNDDDAPTLNTSSTAKVADDDFLAEMTGGAVTTRGAARTGTTKIAGRFGSLFEGGAIAAFALMDGEEAQAEREALAARLGTTPEFIERNSAALSALAEEERHENKVTRALVEWMPSAIGAGLGFFVPIPGSSILFGYLGDQVGDAINPGNPHEVNVRDIAKEVERKQEADERVTSQEAFFLALAPEERKKVYEQMNAAIPEGMDPLVAQQRMDGIIITNSYLIRDKAEALGIEVKQGGNVAIALANAMNRVNPETGVKLHPILVLLDNPEEMEAQDRTVTIAAPERINHTITASDATLGDVQLQRTPALPPRTHGTLNFKP